MASGAADRLDVTGWIPSARTASTTRSGWDAAGVAARAGDSSQDRFGAALSAARARDDAAATRARDETQRSQADAARTTSERARDAADTAKARAAARADGRPTNSAKLPETHGQAQSATSADTSMTRTEAQAPAKASDSASAAAARGTNPTAQPASDAAGAPTPNAATAADAAKTDTTAADSAATETAQVEAVPSEVPPQTAPQAASPAVPGTLQALLAELVKGAPVLAGGAAAGGEGGDLGVTGAAGSATAQADTATAGVGSAGTKPGLASAGTKMGAAPATLRASGQGASPVEAVKAGTSDPAAPEGASGASTGQDFLAALADAGQGAGQGATGGLQAPAPSLPHGNPDLSALAAPQAAGATTAATQAAASTPTPTPVDPAVPIGQVPMTIGLRSLAGSSEFQIRLDPAELGRIDVKLEIDKARGTVTTHLVVERPETLAMLQRDANQLQQALSQAGLDPSAGGLNLSLRSDGNAQGGAGGGQGEAPRGGQAAWAQDRAEAPQETAPTRWLRGYGGLDIRI